MRLANARLVSQMAHFIEMKTFGDMAFLIKQEPTGNFDEYNNAITAEVLVPIMCSFGGVPTRSDIEVWKNYADISGNTAEVRFSGPKPDKGDKFKLVSRFDGSLVHEQLYEIVAIRDRFEFGYQCLLKDSSI